MNLPEKFQVVRVDNGVQINLTRVSIFKYHAAWDWSGSPIEHFYDAEIIDREIEEGKYHIVDRSLPCPGAALRSRTSAEFLDFMLKQTKGMTKEVCTSIAQTVLVLNKAMYGKKPT